MKKLAYEKAILTNNYDITAWMIAIKTFSLTIV